MKLAEALNQRADIKTRLSQLSQRLQNNSKTQQGEAPAENPKELLVELDALTSQLTALVTRINITNTKTISDGESITALLAQRDSASLRVATLREFLKSASEKSTAIPTPKSRLYRP